MPGPYIEPITNPKSPQKKHPNLLNHLFLLDGSRWNGTIGLIDRINITIVPIINCLGVPRQKRSCENHSDETLGGIGCAEHNVSVVFVEGVPHPVVVTGCGGSAHDSPYEWDPGDGFGELEADFPEVGCFGGSFDSEELADVCGSVVCFIVGSLLFSV